LIREEHPKNSMVIMIRTPFQLINKLLFQTILAKPYWTHQLTAFAIVETLFGKMQIDFSGREF